jgi:glycerophosphoryl diester phosphodiesterase
MNFTIDPAHEATPKKTSENARNEAGSVAEMRRYIAEGIDGFFSDDPGLGRIAVGAG